MSFYITDIHPRDAHYHNRHLFIGMKIDIDGPLGSLLRRTGYFDTNYMQTIVNGERRSFIAVQLCWEDY